MPRLHSQHAQETPGHPVQEESPQGNQADLQPACRDYTLNMHKRLQGIQFKKRAPKAIKPISSQLAATTLSTCTRDSRASSSRREPPRQSSRSPASLPRLHSQHAQETPGHPVQEESP